MRTDVIRSDQVLAMLTAGDPSAPLVDRVCQISVQLLDITGAGTCLVSGRHPGWATARVLETCSPRRCPDYQDGTVTGG